MLRRLYLLALFFSICISSASAQGYVRGKISDENGEEIVGAIVYLQDSSAIHADSDLSGDFSLKIPDSKTHTIVVSYVGFDNLKFIIPALRNQTVFKKDFLLHGKNDLEAVDVVTKQVRASDYYMENVKRGSANTLDYVSSETMTKTGDQNVAAAVARIPGISTSGGLITVRGIGDRYVKTTLNGLRIPTLDPLTNNIKLDLFPSSLIDNIIITKTGSPDLPADWSGAYISIETKDYPDNLIVNVVTQIGYNNQTSFKDFLTSDRSKTDWLGFDTGLRDRKHSSLSTPKITPTTYDELSALGLKNYYNGMGITGWSDGSPEGATYFKLGLVQLGLLSPSAINDQAAFNAARLAYNETYKPKAFEIINPQGTDYNNGFANNWNTFTRKAPLSISQTFNVGNQTTLFGKQVGYILGFRYGNAYRYDPNGTSQRYGALLQGEYPLTSSDVSQISRETDGFNGLINLAAKLNSRNSLSFLFMPNVSGNNDVQVISTLSDGTPAQECRTQKYIFYEERKQLISQFKTEHVLPGSKMKIESGFSYTKGNSTVPDFKIYEYGFMRDNTTNIVDQYLYGTSVGNGIRRFYRYLSENVFDSKINFELPISNSEILVRKIKFGAAYQYSTRDQAIYNYAVAAGNRDDLTPLTSDDVNAIMGPENFTVNNNKLGYYYQSAAAAWNATFGYSDIRSAFAMTDFAVNSFFRISGGLRAEYAHLFADVTPYHAMQLARDDIRRENVGGLPYANAADINELNLLPSANLIFKLLEKKENKVGVRLNYSKSIARPSLRELNDAGILDYEFRTLIYGNSDLKTAHITNYDFRTETYFKNGDFISASLFYKDFVNHIESSFGSGGITWNNVGRSYVKGLELEGKLKLAKHFEFRTNLTFVKSNSQVIRSILDVVDGKKVYTLVDTVNRPMYGQAPYIFNTVLTYKSDSIGLTVSVSYNTQGPRLVIAGILAGFLDVYEMPKHLLDLKISKTLGKHFTASISVRDILNAPVRRAYKMPEGYKDYDRYRYGTNYLLSIAYSL